MRLQVCINRRESCRGNDFQALLWEVNEKVGTRRLVFPSQPLNFDQEAIWGSGVWG